MFEAVGIGNWPVYFDAIRERLIPGGKVAIQTITIDDERFDAYRRNPDFIQHYIFPGGVLPSPAKFLGNAAQQGLTITDELFFGRSYAETLRRWQNDFLQAWPEIQDLGFDDRFRRMWLYYLCYSEVGFDIGTTDVAQFTLTRQ